MGSNLELFKLSEKCSVKSSKRIFANEYVDSGIPFMRSKDVIDKALGVFSKYEYFISEKRFRELSDKHGSPETGDILISSVGNRSGQPYVVKDEGEFYFKDGNIIWISKFKNLCPDFLCYWLKSKHGQYCLSNVMIGSAQKALTIDSIRNLEVNFPSYTYQKKASHILGSLDDKIELNRQMNQTLESMAQAMFKSWFVDFDPVIDNALAAGNPIPEPLQKRADIRKQLHNSGQAKPLPEHIQKLFPNSFRLADEMGWVPEGWGVGNVGDIFELHRGFDLPASKRTTGDYVVYSAGGEHGTHGEYKLDPPGVITGRSGVIGKIHLSLERYWPLNTTLYIREYRHGGPFYSFYVLGNLDLQCLNSGSAVPSLNRNTVHSLPAFLPSHRIIERFEESCIGIFSKLKFLQKENSDLSKLRDTLLPKLISGELRIPEAQEQVKEAVA